MSFIFNNGAPWRFQESFNTEESSALSAFTTGTSAPVALYGGVTFVTKNSVYYVGSYGSSSSITAPLNVDGTVGTWTSNPSGNVTSLSRAAGIITKNKAYLIGGRLAATLTNKTYSAVINTDGTLGSWVEKNSLPSGLSFTTPIITKNRIYLLGGYNGSVNVDIIYTALIDQSGEIGTWTATGLTMTVPCSSNTCAAAVYYDDYIWYFNGSWIDRAPVDSNGVITASFVSYGDIPAAAGINALTVVTTDNYVYLIGSVVSVRCPINEMGTLSSWVSCLAVIPVSLGDYGLFVTRSKLYVICGYLSAAVKTVYYTSFAGGRNRYLDNTYDFLHTNRPPVALSDTYVKATTTLGNEFLAWNALDITKSLVGTSNNNSWSSTDNTVPQKINIDHGLAIKLARVAIDNFHHSGTVVYDGVYTIEIYGTNSAVAFANVIGTDITDLTLIGTINVDSHITVDESDIQYFYFPLNVDYFQYTVIRITAGIIGNRFIGLRRIGIHSEENEFFNALIPVISGSASVVHACSGQLSKGSPIIYGTLPQHPVGDLQVKSVSISGYCFADIYCQGNIKSNSLVGISGLAETNIIGAGHFARRRANVFGFFSSDVTLKSPRPEIHSLCINSSTLTGDVNFTATIHGLASPGQLITSELKSPKPRIFSTVIVSNLIAGNICNLKPLINGIAFSTNVISGNVSSYSTIKGESALTETYEVLKYYRPGTCI